MKKDVFKYEISIGRINDVDIMLFTKHLSISLKSGVPLVDALEILQSQAKGKMQKMIQSLLTEISKGKSFSEALKKHSKYFSAIYLNMVYSGERSGTLEENLSRLSVELKKSVALKKKVKSAMIYPALVFVAVFGLGMSIGLFVLPKILPLFQSLDVDLPASTKLLIYFANLFEQYGILIAIAFIAFTIFGLWLLKRDFVKPLTHRLILKLPVVKEIVKNVNLARFNRTLGTLLESGLTVDQSLNITSKVIGHRTYRSAITRMVNSINSGHSIRESISKYPKLFPPITAKMVGIGERTGNLSGTLTYLGDYYEEEVDTTIKNLSTIIEPVLLIVIGILVGGVAMAILGPIYEITGNLR